MFTGIINPAFLGSLDADPNMTFEVFAGNSSYMLPTDITINGSTVSPMLVYYGHRATSSLWTASVGENLSTFSAGSDPSPGQLTPLTMPTAAGVLFNNGKIYQSTNSSFGDIGTEDFIIEAFFKAASSVADGNTVISKYNESGNGWNITGSSTSYRFQAIGTAGEAAINLGLGAWNIIHCFFDNSDSASTGMRIILNGIGVGTSGHTAGISLSNSTFITLGARGNENNKSRCTTGYVAVWKRDSWFAGGSQNTTDWNSFAAERSSRIMGYYPNRFVGVGTPAIRSRATTAYLDRILDEGTNERRLFLVGSGWSRFCKRKEESDDGYLTGALIEGPHTNKCLRSQTFSNATWIKANLTIADGYMAPDADLTAAAMVVDNADGYHSVHQDIAGTAVLHTFSVFAKAGTRNFITLEVADGYGDGYSSSFNLSNGTLGNIIRGSPSRRIESYGSNWYRVQISFTASVLNYNWKIFASNDINNASYAGANGELAAYIWGAQVEANTGGNTIASSYIVTTTAAATRNQDLVAYPITSNWPGGSPATIDVQYLFPNYSVQAATRIFELGDTGNNVIRQWEQNTVSSTGVLSAATQWAISGPDTSDGYIHSLRTLAVTNNVRIYLDGALLGTDTSASIIDGTAASSNISIGKRGAAAVDGPANGIIGQMRIWNTEVLP